MLIGQNVGQDFFPHEIATFTCGLKVSMHQIRLHDEKWYFVLIFIRRGKFVNNFFRLKSSISKKIRILDDRLLRA